MKNKPIKVFYCPVEIALSVIGGKWKPMIMWELKDQSRRFTDIKAALPPVAHKVLSQQLKQLELDGMIKREPNARSTTRAKYALTDFGRTICPMLAALGAWGLHNHTQLGVEYKPFSQGGISV